MSDIYEKNRFKIVYNRSHFTAAAVSIMDLLRAKSIELLPNAGTKAKRYENLQKTCANMLAQYRSEENNFDEGKIIKKVYKTLKSNIQHLKNKDEILFSTKDANNKIVTILPGVDIGLIYNDLDATEKTQFWQHMLLMFVSSVKMIDCANNHQLLDKKKNKEFVDILAEIEKELTKTGVTINNNAYNPYVGLSGAIDGELGVDELFSSDNIPSNDDGLPGMNINTILDQLGIASRFDLSQVNEELKNITEDGIKEAVDNITHMIGADGDSDIGEVCNDLVRSIVGNMKENGINDMMGILRSVTDSVTNKIDPDKMKKTAMTMNSFMKDSTSKLRTMKDEDGNPIGEKLFSAMENPRQMVKDLHDGKLVLPTKK
jgi:hypothetical protein